MITVYGASDDLVEVEDARFRVGDLPAELAALIVVNPETGCWEWQGHILPKGHGQVYWDGRTQQVHRVVYTLLAEPIPDGLVLDHVKKRGCKSNACCWPAHLEPVTGAENTRRGGNAIKTHCKHGHPLSGDNLILKPDGKRQCRECQRRAARESARDRRASGTPVKPQTQISCACGCGTSLLTPAPDGRERRFAHGHNRRKAIQ